LMRDWLVEAGGEYCGDGIHVGILEGAVLLP
jgi:hypothetical protein